jgi:hypothetical protein
MPALEQGVAVAMALPAVNAVRQVASVADVQAHLVGAPLRDLFWGCTPGECEFVVEGDAASIAHQIAARAPGGVLTATDAGVIRYRASHLGRLVFQPANGLSIEAFLTQRVPVTVDALALDVRSGELKMGHGTLADLEHRQLRLLPVDGLSCGSAHYPIRAIRVAISPPTFDIDRATWAQLELSRELVARADAGDVGNELHAMFKGAEHLEALMLLNELGLLDAVLGRLSPLPVVDIGLARAPNSFVESLRRFQLLDGLLAACDAVLPSGFLSRHLSLLRHVLLLLVQINRSDRDDAARCAALYGDRIEETFNRLSSHYASPGICGFRVRMVTQGCCRVMERLRSRAESIREAVTEAFSSLGRRKGLLAALVIGCEWLSDESRGPDDHPAQRAVIDAILSTMSECGVNV